MSKLTDIPSNPDYQVDKNGNVFSKKSKKFLNQYVMKTKHRGETYLRVYLYKQNKRKCHMVHRLVAETYIKNPLRKPTVNHIDGNKKNNAVDNLEWATFSENSKHAFKTGLNRASRGRKNPAMKKINVLDRDGNFIRSFYGAREAIRGGYGTEFRNISAVLRKKRPTHNGYVFEYA